MCEFSIEFSGTPDEVLAKARKAVESQNGQLNGDAQQGNFNVSVFGNKIAGSYSVAAQQLHISITDKPFMVPCSAIESFLKSQVK